MASALIEIADAPDPLNETVDHDTRPNGLRVERVRVPSGHWRGLRESSQRDERRRGTVRA